VEKKPKSAGEKKKLGLAKALKIMKATVRCKGNEIEKGRIPRASQKTQK